MKQAKAPSSSQVENAKSLYDWQRFWVASTGMLDLSDGGFLADPTSPWRRSHPATPATLAELANYRALVLLGEPGIGKSTTLEAEAARVSADPVANSTTSIHVDLRAYSSDALLHQRLFGSPDFIAWTTGNLHLVLHLDSLDEALLRIASQTSWRANCHATNVTHVSEDCLPDCGVAGRNTGAGAEWPLGE
jgi:hypothetical protein